MFFFKLLEVSKNEVPKLELSVAENLSDPQGSIFSQFRSPTQLDSRKKTCLSATESSFPIELIST